MLPVFAAQGGASLPISFLTLRSQSLVEENPSSIPRLRKGIGGRRSPFASTCFHVAFKGQLNVRAVLRAVLALKDSKTVSLSGLTGSTAASSRLSDAALQGSALLFGLGRHRRLWQLVIIIVHEGAFLWWQGLPGTPCHRSLCVPVGR